jgi:branched-chain amino acid transport system permease protein
LAEAAPSADLVIAGRVAVSRGEATAAAAVVLVLALLPLVARPVDMPVLGAGMLALYMAYSWNVVGGMLGELSFVHLVYWGIGAYALVFLGPAPTGLIGAAVVAFAVSAALSAVIVFATAGLRLTGLYYGIFTLVLAVMAVEIVRNASALGGQVGVYLRDYALSPRGLFLVGLSISAFAYAVNVAVRGSTFGLAVLAVKQDPIAAQASGVDLTRTRLAAHLIAALLATLGGIVHAAYLGYAQPDVTMGLLTLVNAVIAVFVGGAGLTAGPLFGTLVIYGLQSVAQIWSTDIQTSLYAQLIQYAISLAIIRFVTSRIRAPAMRRA